MTEEERFNVAGMRASWKAIAQEKTNAERSQIPPNMFKCLSQDLEAEWDSPILFPDKAPKELLAELPPTVVISAEFDMFITGSSNTPLIFHNFFWNPQRLNALWGNFEELGHWRTTVACQVQQAQKMGGCIYVAYYFQKLFLGQFSFALLVYSCDGATIWKVHSKH